MSEPHFTLPKVAIQFGDKERFLCFTNRSLKRMRDEHKFDAIEEFRKGEILDVLPKLLYCGLIWAEKELTLQEVEDYFLDCAGPRDNLRWSLDVAEALTGVRPKPKESEDPPKSGGDTA